MVKAREMLARFWVYSLRGCGAGGITHTTFPVDSPTVFPI
jgi:hypothetical protein